MFPNAKIFGVEHIKELANWSIQNINKYENEINLRNIKVFSLDGRLGLPSKSPFDLIHCGAAFKNHEIPLLKQLRIGGRLIAPVHDIEINPNEQHIWIYDKISQDKITRTKGRKLSYVDIGNSEEQKKKGVFNIFQGDKEFFKKVKKDYKYKNLIRDFIRN